MKRILFCGYREWALKALEMIRSISNAEIVHAQHEANAKSRLTRDKKYDAVFLAGWSWIVDKSFLHDNMVVGVHPSDLPDYAGGSPIQHQILDGVLQTKATLFRISPHLDRGNIVLKDDLDLSGSLSDVFDRLAQVTVRLFVRFEGLLPNPPEHPQVGEGQIRRRLKEHDGQLTVEKLRGMSAVDLYNFLRCREAVGNECPYQHSHYRDETGTVFFVKTAFIPPGQSLMSSR